MTAGGWEAGSPFRFAVGIEDTFIAHEAPGQRKLDEYELTQHYQSWREDLDLVGQSGADSLRWGIPWYRVEPEPGRFTWDWVDQVAEKLRELDLTCVVDLMHYGTPMWLEGAFANRDYPQRVAEYAAAAADRYRDVFRVWTPLNEPVVHAQYCGERGLWPPHLTGSTGFVTVLMQLARGICLTENAIRDVQEDPVFVHVDAGFRFEGHTRPLPRDLMQVWRFLALDLVTGRVDDVHPLAAWLREHGAADADLGWLAEHALTPDVVGVNYYPGFTSLRYREDGTTEPVEAGTAGLEELVRDYWARYARPIMITETSRGGPLADRREWLAQSLTSVRRMRADGVPVIGYTWFPFLALYDWLYREASTPADEFLIQMGLVDLARLPGGGQLVRKPTEALRDFRTATQQGVPPIGEPAGVVAS